MQREQADEAETDTRVTHLKRGNNPAPIGHRYAETHGGYSPVLPDEMEPAVAAIYEWLAAAAPAREGGKLPIYDEPMVRELAEVWVKRNRVRAWIDQHGKLDTARPKWPAIELEARLSRQVVDYLDAMGMTPRARFRMGLDFVRTVDFAQAMSGGAS